MAHEALDEMASGKTIFEITDRQVNRIMICGECQRSGLPPGLSKEVIRSALIPLMDKVIRYREFGADPEVAHINVLKSKTKWRVANREVTHAKAAEKIAASRLEKLRRLYEQES